MRTLTASQPIDDKRHDQSQAGEDFVNQPLVCGDPLMPIKCKCCLRFTGRSREPGDALSTQQLWLVARRLVLPLAAESRRRNRESTRCQAWYRDLAHREILRAVSCKERLAPTSFRNWGAESLWFPSHCQLAPLPRLSCSDGSL